MAVQINTGTSLIDELNQALAWELRAHAMYAHYAAYLKGYQTLALEAYFKSEAAESLTHAARVRDAVAQLGGQAVTDRDATPIVHTEDPEVMLDEALKTEQRAAQAYTTIVPRTTDDPVLHHDLRHIWQDELAAVVETERLMGR